MKPSYGANPESKVKHSHKKVIEHDQQNMKLSSLNYLKASKAIRWTQLDEEKFYDALKVFGENCDLIH